MKCEKSQEIKNTIMYRSRQWPWSSPTRWMTKLRAKMRKKRKTKKKRRERHRRRREETDEEHEREWKNERITLRPFSFCDKNAKWCRRIGLFSLIGTRASYVHSFPETFLFFSFLCTIVPFWPQKRFVLLVFFFFFLFRFFNLFFFFSFFFWTGQN